MMVNEIFKSIDGEGLRTGELTTFIRLAGCNLRCSYCDTCYALKNSNGTEMSVDEIVKMAKKYDYRNITLTGGEPLIHKDVDSLISKLCENGFYVNIETNGSVPIDKYILNKNILITMDYKLPSSGVEKNMNLNNLEKLRENDVLKFVIGKDDFDKVKEVIEKYSIKSYIYLSPVFGEIEPFEIVDFMKIMHTQGIDMSKMRVQVQLHKIIWNPNERGV